MGSVVTLLDTIDSLHLQFSPSKVFRYTVFVGSVVTLLNTIDSPDSSGNS